MIDFFTNATARFSSDKTYRYELTRVWDEPRGFVCWIMLNPSVADAVRNDPTIRRCIGFAKKYGFGGIRVVNLYALCATDPGRLLTAANPVSDMFDAGANDRAIEANVTASALTVAAWGDSGPRNDRRAHDVAEWLSGGVTLKCFGLTKRGNPFHPLYQPLGRGLQIYRRKIA